LEGIGTGQAALSLIWGLKVCDWTGSCSLFLPRSVELAEAATRTPTRNLHQDPRSAKHLPHWLHILHRLRSNDDKPQGIVLSKALDGECLHFANACRQGNTWEMASRVLAQANVD